MYIPSQMPDRASGRIIWDNIVHEYDDCGVICEQQFELEG